MQIIVLCKLFSTLPGTDNYGNIAQTLLGPSNLICQVHAYSTYPASIDPAATILSIQYNDKLHPWSIFTSIVGRQLCPVNILFYSVVI